MNPMSYLRVFRVLLSETQGFSIDVEAADIKPIVRFDPCRSRIRRLSSALSQGRHRSTSWRRLIGFGIIRRRRAELQ